MLPTDRKNPLKEGFRIAGFSLQEVKSGEVAEPSGYPGMVWPSGFFRDFQGAVEQRGGLGIPALVAAKDGNVVEAGGYLPVVWPEEFFSKRQGMQVQFFRLFKLPLLVVAQGEVGKAPRRLVRTPGPQR